MIYCDTNEYILQWSSEEIIVPYYSPVDKKWHRYFPDFYIKYRDKSGQICESLIEIKPKIQTSAPQVKTTPKGRPTSRFLREAITWEVNQAKWKAAQEYCLDRKWEFKIITEKELR
jgi:TnsA endonuclease N terminal